jgi:hypothetical protein
MRDGSQGLTLRAPLAGEAVKPGDDQHGTALAAFVKRCKELRPIRVPAAAFDLGILRYGAGAC